MSESKRGRFIAGVAVGAAAIWLAVSRRGRSLCARVLGRGGDGQPTQPWTAEEPPDDARSEALRDKFDETRRRLREQVGLPPDEEAATDSADDAEGSSAPSE